MKISHRIGQNHDEPIVARTFAFDRGPMLRGVVDDDESHVALVQSQFEARNRHYAAAYPRSELRIYQDAETEVGYAMIDWSDVALLIDFAVAPEWRRKGYGRAILESVLADCAERQLDCSLRVETENPALALYRSMGFEGVGFEDFDIRLIRKCRLDTLDMPK